MVTVTVTDTVGAYFTYKVWARINDRLFYIQLKSFVVRLQASGMVLFYRRVNVKAQYHKLVTIFKVWHGHKYY
jgi:hypothetical protein